MQGVNGGNELPPIEKPYRPEKSGDRKDWFNPHVSSNWWGFWMAVIIGGIPALIMVDWFPMIEKSNVMLRWIFSFYPKAWAVACFVKFCLLYQDTELDGQLFRGVIHSPQACGVFAAAIVVVAGLLAVFC